MATMNAALDRSGPASRSGAIPFRGFNDAPLEERARLMHAMADAGLDGVVQADHVSFRDGSGVEAIVMMAGLSGLHPTLGLFIGVYLLPLRHPVPVARSLATLAQLAPGRVELGVGIGGEDRHEVEVCGVDPRTRGRRCDDSLDIVRRLLAGEEVTHHGEFFDIDACRIRPTPSPPIPVLVGGRSDAAIRRAGRFADGWIGVWCSPTRFAAAAAMCAEEAGAAGRDRRRLPPQAAAVGRSRGDEGGGARRTSLRAMERFYGVPFSAFEKYTPYGTPEDVAEGLAPYVAAGVQRLQPQPLRPRPGHGDRDGRRGEAALLRAEWRVARARRTRPRSSAASARRCCGRARGWPCRLRPPVRSTIWPSRNGVTSCPTTPRASSSASASAITPSISSAGISSAAGIGLAMLTPTRQPEGVPRRVEQCSDLRCAVESARRREAAAA